MPYPPLSGPIVFQEQVGHTPPQQQHLSGSATTTGQSSPQQPPSESGSTQLKSAPKVIHHATGSDASQKLHYFKMLLIGETGSGKTSFVNLLHIFSILQARTGRFDSSEITEFCQFNDVQLESHKTGLYNVELGELKIGIIDTPGLGDCRRMQEDKKNIIAALQDEEFINCICFIINGRQSHTSVTLKYSMSEITAVLPREILNNIFVVFSNTSDVLDLNFDPGELQQFFGQRIQHFFCIENPYCRLKKAKQKQKMLPLDKIAQSLQKAFEDTADVIISLCDTIKEFKQVYTLRFVTLFKKKQEIEKSVFELLTTYKKEKRLEKDLKNAQEEIDSALHAKSLNKHYKSTKRMRTWNVLATSDHNTLCGVRQCYSNCHLSCYLDKSFDKEVLKTCPAFNGNSYCQVCGHHYTLHYHDEVKFVESIQEQEYLHFEMRDKFEAAKSQEEKARTLHDKLKAELEESEKERKRLSIMLLSVMEEFHSLGINRNYAQLIENQLRVIETHIEGAIGDEAADLIKTKEELEKKLEIVKQALKI